MYSLFQLLFDSFIIEYETVNNKTCSVDLFWVTISFFTSTGRTFHSHIEDVFFHNAGRLGKVPDKHISSISTASNNYSFTYETDTEGYVTKIYISKNGGTSKLLYEIEYQN